MMAGGFIYSGIRMAIAKFSRASGEVVEGIYEFTSASGLKYVGQSGNIPARIQQHINSGRLLIGDIASLQVKEVLGGKLAREIAEQLRIDKLGGIYQNGIKMLDNFRNPIGKARRHLLDN